MCLARGAGGGVSLSLDIRRCNSAKDVDQAEKGDWRRAGWGLLWSREVSKTKKTKKK